MPDENPSNAVLFEKIANLNSSCSRIENWLDQISHRSIKHSKILAIHSAFLGLIGIAITIILSKITISF